MLDSIPATEHRSWLERQLGKWLRQLDTVVLGTAAVGGFLLGLADIFFDIGPLERREMEIAVTLLSIIALHGVLQHFISHDMHEDIRRIGRSTQDLLSLDRARRGFARAMAQFIEVQELKFKLRDNTNPAFGRVADGLLTPPFQILENLAEGQVNVPEHLVGTAFGMMLKSFSSRFDAVSNDDLAFWQDDKTIAPRYLSQNVAAIRRGMTVTRLFIFPERQLLNDQERAKIADVLEYQMSVEIGWGVAIYEDLEPSLPAGPLDFALFDGGKALSTFRREGERRFIATFHTGGLIRRNDERIAQQRELYEALLAEVWLVTERFTEQFLGSKDTKFREQLVSDAAMYNRRLHKAIQKKTEHEIFPFVVTTEEAVASKLSDVAAAYRAYREYRVATRIASVEDGRPTLV